MVLAIVTDADRTWALKQCPSWATASWENEDGELVDDGGWLEAKPDEKLSKPNWADFVHEQAERFERYFGYEQKTYEDWSTLWRKSWWPKADPYRRWPSMAKKEFQPFFRRGTKEFVRALEVATPEERKMWKQFGVAQFKPADPRLKLIEEQK